METTNIPIISGGLICFKEDVIAALKAGARAICSTNPEVWSL
jgi:glycerol uptake operon antiterminator